MPTDIAGAAQGRHASCADNFNELVRQQKHPRLRRDIRVCADNLRDASNAIERIINENMTWLAEGDANKLMMALLLMRQHEAEYRLNPKRTDQAAIPRRLQAIHRDFRQYRRHAGDEGGARAQVKTYADTFAQWGEASDRAYPLRALIDIDSQNMLPRADEIIASGAQDIGSGDVGG